MIVSKVLVVPEFGEEGGKGVYLFEKSLSFLSPILCIVFEILKLEQNCSPKLGYFQKSYEKKNEEKMKKKCKNQR